jgi:hypothetical protein
MGIFMVRVCKQCKRGAGSTFATTHSLVLLVPVLLLTAHTAVRGVPAAVVHGLLLTVVALHADIIKSGICKGLN